MGYFSTYFESLISENSLRLRDLHFLVNTIFKAKSWQYETALKGRGSLWDERVKVTFSNIVHVSKFNIPQGQISGKSHSSADL